MLTHEEIISIVNHWIRFDRPLEEMEPIFNKIDMAHPPLQPYAYITRQDVINILNRYLNGELSAEEISQWSWAFFNMGIIDEEPGYVSDLSDVLDSLDGDAARGNTLTPEMARSMIHQLQNARFDPNDT